MTFFSLIFLFFFGVVLVAYVLCFKSARAQNIVLLISSLVFYGYTDLRMIPILVGMTSLIYFLGMSLHKSKSSLLYVSAIIIGLTPLLVFKYFNFFVDSFYDFLSIFFVSVSRPALELIAPLGVSYFTFRLLSYIICIKRGSMSPERDIIAFAAYILFFPSMLSGPIDRADKFLPQLKCPRFLDYTSFSLGIRRIVWGLFLKVCLADILAMYVGAVFGNYQMHNGPSILLAVLMFPVQLYADFSGYSNMAIGLGQMLGITMAENFERPLLANDVKAFWRRWHISLTSWFRDYIYFPLGGSRCSKLKVIRNTFIIFLVSGLWHGADWTFVFWGAYHACLFLPSIIRSNRKHKSDLSFGLHRCFFTYILVSLGFLFFHSESVSDGFNMLKCMVVNQGPLFVNLPVFGYSVIPFLLLLVKELTEEFHWNVFFLNSRFQSIRIIAVAGLIMYSVLFGVFDSESFIYFQF